MHKKVMFRDLAVSSVRYASDLVLPPICVSCRALIVGHNLVCAICWRNLHLITNPVCERYGTPMPGQPDGLSFSSRALLSPPVFSRARAAAHYSGIIKGLIVRFKFEDRHEPVPLFLKLMGEAGRDLLRDADLLMPVPLHRLRLLQRRFNQSAVLALGLSRKFNVPADVVNLKRLRRTRAQVGLQQNERETNVANAFGLSQAGEKAVRGKSVLLIDDVMTTGATANAAAKVIYAAQASRVDVLTVALVAPGFAMDDDDISVR